MGNRYAHLSTNDPRDVLVASRKVPHSCSSNCGLCSGPKYLPSVHSDSVGAITTLRNNLIVSGSKDNTMALTNMDSCETLQLWRGHTDEVTKLAYSHAGGQHVLYSGSRDTSIRAWLFNAEKPVNVFQGHQMIISGLETLEDGRIASGSRDAWVKLWDPNRKAVLREQHISRNLVTHLSANPSHTLLAQTSEDKELKVWDARTLEIVGRMPRMNHILLSCDWSNDGKEVISCCNGFNNDGCEIVVWDIRTMKKLRDLRGHEGSVTGVSYIRDHDLPNKRLVASCSLDRTVKIWNIEDGTLLWSEELSFGADLLAISVPSDRRIVVSGGKGLIADLTFQTKAGRPYLKLHSVQKITE